VTSFAAGPLFQPLIRDIIAEVKATAAVLEADAPEPNAKVVRMSKAPAPARASIVQMGRTPVAEDEIVPEPGRAPVARMY
jgi:hypothetical protein